MCAQFDVVLGTDFAGKSTLLGELVRSEPAIEVVSTDDEFVSDEYDLIPRLRNDLVAEVLPAVRRRWSPDFAAGLMQMAVLYLRDQVERAAEARPGTPVLVDSYYYKILAKCRLAGLGGEGLFAWWQSFPQPRRVLFLDVSAETAWRRSRAGAATNPLEHYGDDPGWPGFRQFHDDLRAALLREVAALPVTIIEEQEGVPVAAAALRKAMAYAA